MITLERLKEVLFAPGINNVLGDGNGNRCAIGKISILSLNWLPGIIGFHLASYNNTGLKVDLSTYLKDFDKAEPYGVEDPHFWTHLDATVTGILSDELNKSSMSLEAWDYCVNLKHELDTRPVSELSRKLVEA